MSGEHRYFLKKVTVDERNSLLCYGVEKKKLRRLQEGLIVVYILDAY